MRLRDQTYESLEDCVDRCGVVAEPDVGDADNAVTLAGRGQGCKSESERGHESETHDGGERIKRRVVLNEWYRVVVENG